MSLSASEYSSEYEGLYYFQHMLMKSAHKAQHLKYKVKMLFDKQLSKYACCIYYSPKLPFGAMYVSAKDFIEMKPEPVYRVGIFMFDENRQPTFKECLQITTLDDKSVEYLVDTIKDDVHIDKEDVTKMIKFLLNDRQFVNWAEPTEFKVFIRRRWNDDRTRLIPSTNY